jgi:hypothetical protein
MVEYWQPDAHTVRVAAESCESTNAAASAISGASAFERLFFI